MNRPVASEESAWAAALLARVAGGDEIALAEFYQRYGGALYGLALRILHDPSDAEDAVQEGLASVWRKAASFDPRRSSAFAWSVMIVRHKAIDRLRSRQRVDRLATVAQTDPAAFTTSDEISAEIPLANERGKLVRLALQKIPVDQRQALELAFFGGLTQEQIAAHVAAPLGTIKARIRRGLLKLRECLKEDA